MYDLDYCIYVTSRLTKKDTAIINICYQPYFKISKNRRGKG